MKPTIEQVREALLLEADATEHMNAGADAWVSSSPEYLRALAASLDGMVLVPREPTPKMRRAGIDAIEDNEPGNYRLCDGDGSDHEVISAVWLAMLAAAQEETP